MGPLGSPETSVSNHLTGRNNPEDGRIQFNRGQRQRSRSEGFANTHYKMKPGGMIAEQGL
jgi:ABC-type branched-subunit amino acid transport system ATPase component